MVSKNNILKNFKFNLEYWGYQFQKKYGLQKRYTGFYGIMLANRKFIGLSISDNNIVINLKTMETKRNITLYIYVWFYLFSVDLYEEK